MGFRDLSDSYLHIANQDVFVRHAPLLQSIMSHGYLFLFV
jgi:hypothetical protein